MAADPMVTVRVSSLCGRDVIDQTGTHHGHVIDIRAVQDGPFIEGFGSALRLETLVLGRRGTPTRLGYVRGGVKGPAVLRWLSTRIEERCLVVPWSDVAGVDGDVHLRRQAADLRRIRDVISTW